MSKKLIFFLLMLGTLPSILSAEEQFRLYNWNLYSSLHDVRSVSIDTKGRIWSGTSGGLFVYDEIADTAATFNSLNGLLYNDVSCVYYDAITNYSIIALADGTIELIDQDFNITHITSIRDANFPKPNINKIISLGDKIYIAGGFGVTIFDLNQQIFISTISKIASWTKNKEINDIVIHDNKLWACSDVGVAQCQLDLLPEVPYNWTIFGNVEGLSNNSINTLLIHEDNLFAITDYYVFSYNNTDFSKTYQSETKIIKAFIADNNIQLLGNENIKSIDNTVFFEGIANGVFPDPLKNRTMIYTADGLKIYENGQITKSFSPNSPKHNLFSRLAVDGSGNLWTVSASLATAYYQGGLSSLKNGQWENINKANTPALLNDNLFDLNILPNGNIYASAYGGGMTVFNPNDNSIEVYNRDNSLFSGNNASGFLVIGGTSQDANGTVWFTNWGSVSAGPLLVSVDPSGQQKSYQNCVYPNERRVLRLAIDNSGTKWVGSFPGEGRGIFYFNERGTPDNSADDVCGMISTSTHSNLPDNSPTVIKKDANGNLWLGFGQGISIIRNPQSVLSSNSVNIQSVSFMNGQKVNDILIDPIGNIWVATASGVWVISSSLELIIQLNPENSPIKEKNVISLVGDFKNGIIYFGTEKGLYSAHSLSVQPLDGYNILCYPQPFNLKKDSEMIIDGLTENSELSIVTINGELIRLIKSYGKKAIWNGRDSNNNKVSSGIYLVIANSSSSGSVQKIAVIAE